MRAIPTGLLLAVVCGGLLALAAAEQPTTKGKVAKAKGQPRELDPWDRPAGSIVDQTARYYVWYDKQGWHVRATAKGLRTFSGTISIKQGSIKSCVPVGLKDGKQKGIPDVWKVNDARSQLAFRFRTAQKSDGFDLVVQGDGKIEFDLGIDNQKKPAAIFIGAGKRHPSSNPFTLPAAPPKK
jgi:hypothetical protein